MDVKTPPPPTTPPPPPPQQQRRRRRLWRSTSLLQQRRRWTWQPQLPEEEEEEEERLHNINKDKYDKEVELINEETTSFDKLLAVRVFSELRCIKEPLKWMDGSVLHEVIAREKTDLALGIIIGLLKVTGCDMLSHKNSYGDTPLHIAARTGDSAVAEALLNKNTELVLEKNRKGETPLHEAAKCGHLDVFNIIIKAGGCNLACDRTDDGSTILHYAIMRDQTREALAIAKEFPELISTRNSYGATPLQLMADFFIKPTKTGNLISLLYQCLTSEKEKQGKKEKQRRADGESGNICGSNRENWWSRLSGRRIVKVAAGEMSNYKMKIVLLERLVRNNDDLSFYFAGSTADRSISSNIADWVAREQVKSSHGSVDADDNIIWEQSPMITGIRLGIDDFVIQILRLSPWPATYVDNEGRNLLQAAVKYGRRLVVKAIKEDNRLPPWLFTTLESGTNNTLLHIAATSKNIQKEADPLCMQDELEWFEVMEKIVPEKMWNYRNIKGKTAREVFDEEHEKIVENCRGQLKEIGRTCSPLLAAVVFTSSFYIPNENNRDRNRLAFKIFSHVYVVGFSCAATSLVMFLLLAVKPFTQRDFRRSVPCHYLMSCFLLAMSLAAFIVAFACNMYLQLYGGQRKPDINMAKLLLELLLIPFLSALVLSLLTGASLTFSTLKRLIK